MAQLEVPSPYTSFILSPLFFILRFIFSPSLLAISILSSQLNQGTFYFLFQSISHLKNKNNLWAIDFAFCINLFIDVYQFRVLRIINSSECFTFCTDLSVQLSPVE